MDAPAPYLPPEKSLQSIGDDRDNDPNSGNFTAPPESHQPLLLKFEIREAIISNKSLVDLDPKFRLEFARLIPTNQNVMPLLWIDMDENEMDTIAGSPVVHGARKYLVTPGRILVEIEWTREFQNWITSISSNGIYLLSAISDAGSRHWSCIVWVPNRKLIPDFFEQVTSRNLEITVSEQIQYPDCN